MYEADSTGATPAHERRGKPRAQGPHRLYERWSKAELYEKARREGVPGRSRMSWRELIAALRSR